MMTLGRKEKATPTDNEPQLLGEARSAMNDVINMNCIEPDTLTLQERVEMLNADQRRVFAKIQDHLLHQKHHEQNECSCADLNPLRMFVSGVGGTGKSFLIETLKAQVEDMWQTDDLTCAIAAPTGLAAFNIGGITIHRLFQLPVEHNSKAAGYWSLPKTSQKVMKTTLRSMKLIIIDEISMVSSLNLAYMHLRLEELFGGSDWFGSCNVLFVGDLLQLQPVNGKPIFEKVTKKSLCLKLGCATCPNIWKDCVIYDELTINERQKNDAQFSTLLECGSPTEESLHTLGERVIEGTISDKFRELQGLGQRPVCLFPTRKACEDFNIEMLNCLDTRMHEISCIDEVDETKSTCKWHAKAAEQLEKLNKDCNNTAGLEAKLVLTVGARVMLRRNIDTKAGLALGTVVTITQDHVTVKFDHLSEAFDVEKVKGKFMVMKNYFVYRKQFPIILAYAVTIHKCQGLSLDCAIIDLSDRVFAPGMAYVALSRVRSISGLKLHLVAFDPTSIRVSQNSLEEFNRLRAAHRKDLSQYSLPARAKSGSKRIRAECSLVPDVPDSKRRRYTKTAGRKAADGGRPPKRKSEDPPETEKGSKRLCTDDLIFTGEEELPLKYHPIDELWQRDTCETLSLEFVTSSKVDPGSADMPLTKPSRTRAIVGDGNCMFRSFSYVITGSETHHMAVRMAIVEHMKTISDSLLNKHLRGYTSIDQYIRATDMDKPGKWGTLTEILTLADLLKTCIYTYDTVRRKWSRHSPHFVDRTVTDDVTRKGMYLRHPVCHYDVVLSTETDATNVSSPPKTKTGSNGPTHGAAPQESNTSSV